MTLVISHLTNPFFAISQNLLEAHPPNYIKNLFSLSYSIAHMGEEDSDIDKDRPFFLFYFIYSFFFFWLLIYHFFCHSLGSPVLGHFKAILGVVIVLNGLINLSLSVHDKWTMLDNWLIQWLPSSKHKPQWL